MSFQKKFVLTPIDKASNTVSISCKRYYVEVVLKEIGILGSGNETYEKANRSKDEIVDLSMTIENTLKDSVMNSLKRKKSFLP